MSGVANREKDYCLPTAPSLGRASHRGCISEIFRDFLAGAFFACIEPAAIRRLPALAAGDLSEARCGPLLRWRREALEFFEPVFDDYYFGRHLRGVGPAHFLHHQKSLSVRMHRIIEIPATGVRHRVEQVLLRPWESRS